MGQEDKQFNAFLRMLIARIKAVVEAESPEKAKRLMQEILDDLQTTLED